jgi:hypothetical protein
MNPERRSGQDRRKGPDRRRRIFDRRNAGQIERFANWLAFRKRRLIYFIILSLVFYAVFITSAVYISFQSHKLIGIIALAIALVCALLLGRDYENESKE